MGPDTENTPEQKAEIASAAAPSNDYWEVTVKVTVKADNAEEAQAQVEEMLDNDDRVISYEYPEDVEPA